MANNNSSYLPLFSAVLFHTRGGRRRSVCTAGGHRAAQHQVRFPQRHHPGGALLGGHEPLLQLPGPHWLIPVPGRTGADRTRTGPQARFHFLLVEWDLRELHKRVGEISFFSPCCLPFFKTWNQTSHRSIFCFPLSSALEKLRFTRNTVTVSLETLIRGCTLI